MKKTMCIFLFLYILIGSFFSKEFNKEGLFSFDYPEDKVEVFDISKVNSKRSKEMITLFLEIDKINNHIEDTTTFLTNEGIKKDRENLINGNLNNVEYKKMINPEIIKINGIYGKKFLILDKPIIDTLFFQLNLIFYIKNYRIVLTLDDYIHEKELIQENINCYIKTVNKSFISDEMITNYYLDYDSDYRNIFHKSLLDENKKASYEWNKIFGEIINSIKIVDSKYFSPNINNLRFRETPDLTGKFIRKLKKGERLELIEKGKEETIQDDEGTWVKVITDKGEVGWCFDAYLDEVKKK